MASYEDTDGDGTKEYYYNHQDHLGGTALTTDSTGTVMQLYDYYPYGSELLDSQPTGASAPSEHSFTDKELDDDLGLYYFEARWYDSSIGRFSSQDPAQWTQVEKLLGDPQQLNFYSYSRNNPIVLTDPTGQSAIGDFVGGFVNSWYSNMTFGAGRYDDSNNSAYSAGQFLGDATSMLTGAMEVLTGGTIAGGGAAGGLVLTPRPGAVSVPVVSGTSLVVGGTIAAHGATTMLSGGQNLSNDSQSSSNSGGSKYGATPDGHEYTKHGYNQAKDRGISGEQIDATIKNYTDTFDGSKGKTGYYNSESNITVITGDNGKIVTTHEGMPAQLTQ